jgi:DNA-binding NarL/FixJ family response regulator
MKPSNSAKSNSHRRYRVLLVDDHPLVRERLAEIINAEADLTVCGEAEDRAGAIEAIKASRPDVAVIDITLKDSDGLELIKDIHSRWPRLRVLVVSMHDESLYAQRAIRVGALGYITKQDATRNILLAIRRVLEGNIYLNPRVATRIIQHLALPAAQAEPNPADLLAHREMQVFELTGHGLDIRQVAQRLRIGVKTVETYRLRIREKLGLTDASQLLPAAIAWVHRR